MSISTVILARNLVTYLRSYKPPKEGDGRSLTDVAREFGVTRHAIRQLAKRYNIELKFEQQKGRSPEDSMVYLVEEDKITSRGSKITFPNSPFRTLRGGITLANPKHQIETKPFVPLVDPSAKRKGKLPTKLSEDKQKFLFENYHRPVTQLVRESGISLYIVKRFFAEHNLERPKIVKSPKEKKVKIIVKTLPKKKKVKGISTISHPKAPRKVKPSYSFSEAQLSIISTHVGTPCAKLAQELGVTTSILKGYLKRNGLYVTKKLKGTTV
jgi:hypothetical protein